MPWALDPSIRREERETSQLRISEHEPTHEMWWALSQADTFFIPKGRLRRPILRHLGNCGISVPHTLSETGEIEHQGRTFVFAPDSEIVDFFLSTPTNAVGFTATHQLIERGETPIKYTQAMLSLWHSRFALACRIGEAEQIAEGIGLGELQLGCTEYQRTFEQLGNIYELPIKMEARRGSAELTLRRYPEFSVAGVITETEISIDNSGLDLLFDYMGPVEVSAISNVPLLQDILQEMGETAL